MSQLSFTPLVPSVSGKERGRFTVNMAESHLRRAVQASYLLELQRVPQENQSQLLLVDCRRIFLLRVPKSASIEPKIIFRQVMYFAYYSHFYITIMDGYPSFPVTSSTSR